MSIESLSIVRGGARRLTRLSLVGVVWMVSVASAVAQPAGRPFSGLYLGAEIGRLNVIGGALVNSEDTLAQDTRRGITGIAGARYQFASRVVFGAEIGYGREDGDLQLADAARQLDITYDNDAHWRIGVTAGVVMGALRRTHTFVYLSELSRNFDVTIVQGGVVMTQRDEQGLLRYGVGLEQLLSGRLSVRGTLGSSRADFGDRRTNIEVERPIEAAIGLLVRF